MLRLAKKKNMHAKVCHVCGVEVVQTGGRKVVVQSEDRGLTLHPMQVGKSIFEQDTLPPTAPNMFLIV